MKGLRVRFSPAAPNKEAYFDRIICFLFHCRKALISRDFSVLRHKAARPGVVSGTGFSRFLRLQRSAVKVKVCFVGISFAFWVKVCFVGNRLLLQTSSCYTQEIMKYAKYKRMQAKLQEQSKQRKDQADSIGALMFELHETENPITSFDNKLWISVIESITVKNNGTLLFRFRNGMEIEG